MKQKIAKVLMLSLLVGLLTGCAGTPVVYYTECNCTEEIHNNVAESQPVQEEKELAEGALKTGLAIVASVANSENGKVADYDVTQVAVLVDDEGVIRDCVIDGIATKVNFDANGAITTDLTADVATKNELGANYGMVAWGGAIAEWDAQADALAQYAVGKTVEELKNGAVDETGKAPAGTDLATKATIYLGGYVSAIEAAVENAKHLGAESGDELRLTSINSVGSSASATAEKAGVAQLDIDATAITVKNGKITSCYIDSMQAKVNFDQKGVITTDLTAPVQTKNQLGENYGMVAWGGAIAEWDAQAASFAEYVTGKTAAEVAGIAVNEKTAPTDADLATSVTIAIGGFQNLIDKALQGTVIAEEASALKTGLAIVASVANSENGKVADYDVTQVAVLVDDEGVIRDCVIDGIATKVNFDANGAITTDLTADVATKNELGANYGMVAWGGAIAEWDAQADALAQYAVGKTVEELKNGAVDETGKAPAGTDLATKATIYLGGYVSAIEAAVENAKHLGAESGDELRLTSINSVGSSASATAEKAGVAQLDIDATALTVKDGVITSCYIDSMQAKVNFDNKGVITTDLTAPVQTKNQLGENYGMVAWGGAIAEWDAQAASFAEYVTGKTAAEVAGVAVNEKTAPTDADLATSVTIAIGGFQALLEKALQ